CLSSSRSLSAIGPSEIGLDLLREILEAGLEPLLLQLLELAAGLDLPQEAVEVVEHLLVALLDRPADVRWAFHDRLPDLEDARPLRHHREQADLDVDDIVDAAVGEILVRLGTGGILDDLAHLAAGRGDHLLELRQAREEHAAGLHADRLARQVLDA